MTRLTFAAGRLAALPASLWSDYRRHAGERAAIARLSGLSDQLLRDMGLDRGGIREAARTGLRRR